MLYNQRHGEFSLLYSPAPAEAQDAVLVFRGGEVLLRADILEGRFPLWEDIRGVFSGLFPLHAFSQGKQRYFIATAQADTSAPQGYIWEAMRVFRKLQPETDGALLNAARHLWTWYENHRFCGSCAGVMHPHSVERALCCESCGTITYPSVLPAVIVAVIHGDKLLLARNAQGAFRLFSLLAGYVEVGETAEQTVAREVYEEVGLRVKNIRYIASQPWGFSQSLMLGYKAELDGAADIRLQESELAEARWFSREDIPRNDSSSSIAFDIMERFRRGEL